MRLPVPLVLASIVATTACSLLVDTSGYAGGGSVTTDCSGRGHDGPITGTGTSRTTGHSGGALAFDGNDGCVALGGPSDLVLSGSFTLAAWVQVAQFEQPGTGDSRAIIAKTTKATDNGWRVVSDNADPQGILAFKIGQASGTTFTVNSPQGQPLAPTWLHVAARARPSRRSIIEDPSSLAFVGCVKPGGGVFKGVIDEMRVYTRALQASEILALAR